MGSIMRQHSLLAILLGSLFALGGTQQALDGCDCPVDNCDCLPGDTCRDERMSTEKLAKSLVDSFWRDVVAKNVPGYSEMIADDFQGLNNGGHYDKEDQVNGLAHLTLNAFKIKHMEVAKYGKTLAISYDFYAKGVGIVSGPSIDVWHNEGCDWSLISHSYVPFK